MSATVWILLAIGYLCFGFVIVDRAAQKLRQGPFSSVVEACGRASLITAFWMCVLVWPLPVSLAVVDAVRRELRK